MCRNKMLSRKLLPNELKAKLSKHKLMVSFRKCVCLALYIKTSQRESQVSWCVTQMMI